MPSEAFACSHGKSCREWEVGTGPTPGVVVVELSELVLDGFLRAREKKAVGLASPCPPCRVRPGPWHDPGAMAAPPIGSCLLWRKLALLWDGVAVLPRAETTGRVPGRYSGI